MMSNSYSRDIAETMLQLVSNFHDISWSMVIELLDIMLQLLFFSRGNS